MTHINQRRDTAANWTFSNPVLQLGEVGWETDTLAAKLGDGETPWNGLSYAVAASIVTSVNGQGGDVVIDKADIGLGNVDNTADMNKPLSNPQKVNVRGLITGLATDLGNVSGDIDISSIVETDMINGTLFLRMTGNAAFSISFMPHGLDPGTQFAAVVTQDVVGGWALDFIGMYKPSGTLTISENPNSVSVVVFFYDGARWFVSLSGRDFAV